MPGKVLRRCDICGNFHAAYIVPEGDSGKRYYCYKCWKAHMALSLGSQPENTPDLAELKPEALQRNLIYQSRWVNLSVDRVRFPNGVIIEQHHLLDFERPAVMTIARGQDGRYLMVKVCRYPTGRTEWEFPAGGVEPGEDITAAAQRELKEESGYSSTSPEILYAYNPLNGIANQVFYILRCPVIGAQAAFDKDEISEVRWFAKDEIWQMLRTGEIKDGYTLTAFLLDQHL
jgi:ADP-ribose pyrophosphatase